MGYTLHCPICKVVTGHIGDQHPGPIPLIDGVPAEYCTIHHPDQLFHQDLISPAPKRIKSVAPGPIRSDEADARDPDSQEGVAI